MLQPKVTKRLAKSIDKLVKERKIAEEAYFDQVSSFNYPGGSFSPEGDIDFDPCTGKYNVIKVIYPYEYYACPLIISTGMLREECRFHHVETGDDYIEMLVNLIKI